ncbi:hypothetical protein L810_6943 [Burkholderia sp. AU4i]|uniref:hypothetical protein n=1 Tax=Burkholderia sp. AU4i TaxID=1335308 RepID=UPI0003987B21|nr:hypothetical protein [Burkholderia sp. AU4i]ERJ38726.1 hypothetical protein L810_6943 [Burkholderia sp. AU4i]
MNQSAEQSILEQSLDELVAERNRLNMAIRAKLTDPCTDLTVEQLNRLRQEALVDLMPDFVDRMLKYLRMHSIALVFHDGRIEHDATGYTPALAVKKAVMEHGWHGYPDTFRSKLADALFANIFDVRADLDKAPMARWKTNDTPSSLS